MSPSGPLRATEAFAALGIVVSSLEMLAIRHEFRSDGWLSWRIHRLSNLPLTRVIERLRVDRMFRYPAVLVLISVRASAALATLVFAALDFPRLPAITIAAGANVLLVLRNAAGNDGADQMTMLVLLPAVAAEALASSDAAKAVLLFVAGQSALAYTTSGLLKLLRRGWHDGTYVTDILRTSSFGSRGLLRAVERRPFLARGLGSAVAVGDCLLGLAFLTPPPVCAGLLGFGIAMHIGISRVLGLNTFLWAFASTYPAVWWASASMYGARSLW